MDFTGQNWIGEYLQIEGFKEAIWWFIAHTTDYMDAEKETIVSQYSSVPRDDFQRGGYRCGIGTTACIRQWAGRMEAPSKSRLSTSPKAWAIAA